MKIRNRSLLKGSKKILQIGLPFIITELLCILFDLSRMSTYDIVKSELYIIGSLEHIIMGLTLLIGGTLLFDIAIREQCQNT